MVGPLRSPANCKQDALHHSLHKESGRWPRFLRAPARQPSELPKNLNREGIQSAMIHGYRIFRNRNRTSRLGRLSRGRYRVLVATDLASRRNPVCHDIAHSSTTICSGNVCRELFTSWAQRAVQRARFRVVTLFTREQRSELSLGAYAGTGWRGGPGGGLPERKDRAPTMVTSLRQRPEGLGSALLPGRSPLQAHIEGETGLGNSRGKVPPPLQRRGGLSPPLFCTASDAKAVTIHLTVAK